MPEQTTYEKGGAPHRMTLKEVPTEALAMLGQQHERVVVGIKRRNNRGQLASLGYSGMVMTPKEVMEIANWIGPRAGGGVYTVDVVSTADTLNRLVPPFEVVIEGMPRPPMSLHTPLMPSSGHPGMPAMDQSMPRFDPFSTAPIPGAMSPHDSPLIPGVNDMPRLPMDWSQGLHPQVRAMYEQQVQQAQRMHPGVQLPPGASIASDQLAVEALRRAESRSAELDAQLKAMMLRAEERERALLEQVREERERAREELHKQQLAAMEQRMSQLAAPKAPERSIAAEMTPLVAAMAPIIASMIASGKEQQIAMMQQQQAAQQASQVAQQQFMAMIAEQAKKPQPDPLAAIEKLAPLLSLGKSDGTANAALMEAMGNLQLQQMGMMAQMVETMGGGQSDSPPAWLPVVQQIAGGLVQMSQAMNADQQRTTMEQQARAQQQAAQIAQQRGLPSGQPPQQPQVIQSRPVEPRPSVVVPYQTVAAPGAPLKITPAMLTMLPKEFQTPEWKGIIVGLHDMKDPAELGTMLARYIGHLDEFNMLPAVLHNFHENPAEALLRLVQPLPVFATHRVYIDSVVEATIQAMLEHGVLVLASDTPEHEEQHEEEHTEEEEHEEEEQPEETSGSFAVPEVLATDTPA